MSLQMTKCAEKIMQTLHIKCSPSSRRAILLHMMRNAFDCLIYKQLSILNKKRKQNDRTECPNFSLDGVAYLTNDKS